MKLFKFKKTKKENKVRLTEYRDIFSLYKSKENGTIYKSEVGLLLKALGYRGRNHICGVTHTRTKMSHQTLQQKNVS